MPSDSNGNYSLPGGYLANPGDTILPSQHNPPLEDIAGALTGRLMRSGAGPMTGAIKLIDGAVGAPAAVFNSALTTGWYKTADGMGFAVSGTLVLEITPAGLKVLDKAQFVTEVLFADKAVTLRKLFHPSAVSRILGSNAAAPQAISGAANNGAGLIRLTMPSTAAYATGQKKIVSDVVGTTEANGRWTITVVDATRIDLQGSAFANNYVSGGVIGEGLDELTLTQVLDFVGSAARGDLLTRGASDWLRLAIGAAGMVPISNGTDLVSGYPKLQLLHVADVRAAGAAGDATPNATWGTKTLQTTHTNEIAGATLSSNQISLPAGTYEIDARAGVPGPGANSMTCQLRLRNITDSATLLSGLAFVSANVAGGVLPLAGRFTLSGTKTLELQIWTGFNIGNALSNTGESNRFTDVLIWKVA